MVRIRFLQVAENVNTMLPHTGIHIGNPVKKIISCWDGNTMDMNTINNFIVWRKSKLNGN